MNVGDAVIIKATYKDTDGDLTDPETPVTLAIRSPSGDTTITVATRQSEGVFEVEYVTTQSGSHDFTFFTSDDSVTTGRFKVDRVIAHQ